MRNRDNSKVWLTQLAKWTAYYKAIKVTAKAKTNNKKILKGNIKDAYKAKTTSKGTTK